ncbi:MucR family transcriptional regulator [Methylobacterium sp. P31]
MQDDGLVSFIDGKRYKSLKRHLAANGLDARAYRERFGLGADYPMVAPSYAAERAAIAKRIGLGRPGAMAGPLTRAAEAPARSVKRKAAYVQNSGRRESVVDRDRLDEYAKYEGEIRVKLPKGSRFSLPIERCG